MDRFDPSAHANYVTTLLLIAIALERLVSTPRTHAVAVVVGRVRALERWVQARVPALARGQAPALRGHLGSELGGVRGGRRAQPVSGARLRAPDS
ncbi:MAG: hypothetical protein IPK07_17960 [Deltaproteobacteria bacterium]|nr:hypothetical protein [Deltaproteobacteria bacterium]